MNMQYKLIQKLKEYDASGISFFDAKEMLLKQGYTDSQIAKAVYSVNYDGRPDKPVAISSTTMAFLSNPDDAQKVSEYILQNSAQKPTQKASIDYLASRLAPGWHAKSYYELKFADDIGYPYFTVMGSYIFLGPAVMFLNLSLYILFVPVVLGVVWVLVRSLLNR